MDDVDSLAGSLDDSDSFSSYGEGDISGGYSGSKDSSEPISENKEVKELNRQAEETLIEAKNFFEYYKKQIGESLRERSEVVFIDFNELMEFSNSLAEEVINNPENTISIIEQAIEESGLTQKVRVRFYNVPESHKVLISELRAKHLDSLILLEGIIRQTSDIRPQVVNAKFECPSCGTVISVLQLEKKFREPSRCSCGRRGGFKMIAKDMVDTQRVVVEESPESLSGGEQPKRMHVFIKEDLVEPRMEKKTTPGSRVRVIGVLKEVPVPLKTGGLSTRYELAIEANNIVPLEETFDELKIDEEDEKEILELAEDPEVFQKLSNSIAPSVWGYPEIKGALALQLFGGLQKQRSDGSKTRGDVHILMMGDPGVAKSVMLGFMARISPKGRYVVGKSTSGAGLTATVVKDEYLKGWSLEAGAMVLCNKGLVCIDELEKMDPQDRSAMHEAMEQQTVTISKANVQATLRSETSVLAAANPKFGVFDPYQEIAQQIDLPPTLLNRFDLMFILRDLPSKERDERIAEHILETEKEGEKVNIITPELFRKYVAYAKQKIKPLLTEEAVKALKDFYVTLRNSPVSQESGVRAVPISARQLTALVRLSEASAKMRLSDKVTSEDTNRAIDLMKYYLMHVGYDPETNQLDINRIATGISSSRRNKIVTVREMIAVLEEKNGAIVPIEELEKALEGTMTETEVEDAIQKLRESGDMYEPRPGHIARTKK